MNAMNKEPEHQEIEALLPWYAAGTPSRRDANRVEQALAGDRELARQYDLVREELVETIHLNETLGAPSTRAIERRSPQSMPRRHGRRATAAGSTSAAASRSSCRSLLRARLPGPQPPPPLPSWCKRP